MVKKGKNRKQKKQPPEKVNRKKRSTEDSEPKKRRKVPGYTNIILDIEGTTTPLSFVKEELFPLVTKNIKQFLIDRWSNDSLQQTVEKLREQSLQDQKEGMEGCVLVLSKEDEKQEIMDSLCSNVGWQMSFDRKSGPLKELQGMIWKDAYESGTVQGMYSYYLI